MHIWTPRDCRSRKKKRGAHFEFRARLIGRDGSQLWDSGWRPNILHDDGEQFLLQTAFAPLGTRMQVVAEECWYDHADHADGAKCLHNVGGAAAPFATVAAGDYLYLAGTAEVTEGVYEVASVGGDDENVLLSSAPTANVDAGTNVVGGVVALRSYRYAIGLDSRTVLAERDGIATAESYEETLGSYARQLVCPMDSGKWTIAKDAVTEDYQATSAQVLFTPVAVNYGANNNAFVVAFTGTVASPSNEVLLSTFAFGSSITVEVGQSLPVQYRFRLTESS